MEITKLNIISDFVSPFPRVPQVYNSFLKWGALILALIATFTSVLTRIKLFVIRVRSINRSSSKQLLQCFDDDFDFSDDDDDTSSIQSEFDAGQDYASSSSSDDETQNQFDDDFRVAGSSSFVNDKEWRNKNGDLQLRLRRSAFDLFSLSDFAAGKGVVKLWDSLGLGVDYKDSSESEISIWDLDKEQKVHTYFAGKGQVPAVSKLSPAVVYLAEMSEGDRFLLGAYDQRISNKTPAVYADWGPQSGNLVSSDGVEKFYVNNGGGAGGQLMIGDLRKVRTPLNSLTETNGEMWWDADAVIN